MWYQHRVIKQPHPTNPDWIWTCTLCHDWWASRPQSRCPGLPLMPYPIPETAKTAVQLRNAGLKRSENQQPIGCIRMGPRKDILFYYYDVAAAIPLTQEERDAVKADQQRRRKAAIQRRTCTDCGTVQDRWAAQEMEHGLCVPCQIKAEDARIAQDRQALVAWAQAALVDPAAVILDTETTDLDGYCVELAIIDMTGTVLFHERFNPLVPIADEAMDIHGISNAEVAAYRPFTDYLPSIRHVLGGKHIYIYNATFDHTILAREAQRTTGVVAAKSHRIYGATSWHCVMLAYAQWVGEWSEYHQDYTWQRLPGGDHTAIGDARAALAVMQRMAGIQEPPPLGEQLPLGGDAA